MTEKNATPTDDLAVLAARAERGEVTHIDLIDAFLAATVFVPSTTDPAEGTVDPVLTKVDETEFMVVASTAEALEITGDVAAFGVPMLGRAVVTGMNPELALMVNTTDGAFAMPQGMLADIRNTNPLG
ncbi:hypothetical protein [Microbacterium gorillae]|uniref:hypothetical protein n=1 Tax=Microbacterium gorillae TaxID=1231063 RepID=UPI00058FCF57|nr:hypothetical protein [Microbacterium gorillae]